MSIFPFFLGAINAILLFVVVGVSAAQPGLFTPPGAIALVALQAANAIAAYHLFARMDRGQ